jgi:hypothetical protein
MNEEQIVVVKCAYADLVGVLQCYNQHETTVHDWESHYQTIRDLEDVFSDIIEPISVGVKR